MIAVFRVALIAVVPAFSAAQQPGERLRLKFHEELASVLIDTMHVHVRFSPVRSRTGTDSARALGIGIELRKAIEKYRDTSVALGDGFRLLPSDMRVYHYMSRENTLLEMARFDPRRPSSLLYRRAADGRLQLFGAMYMAPDDATPDDLDARIPLSIGRWHKHVFWCVPKLGDELRWFEKRDGRYVFGPNSPVSTKPECDSLGGEFWQTVGPWMIHANVFEGDDIDTIWSLGEPMTAQPPTGTPSPHHP